MKKYFIAKSRRLRGTPYSSRIEKQGVTAYTIYNHMLLPAGFGSLEDSYFHLKENVQVWDVAAERQVEISGKDSAELVQLMTCRDLSKSKVRRCYYCPIIDDKAGLINDPVILKLDEDRWWISIADSDVILFAKGLAIGKKFEVKIFEPNVDILAVQGPKSFELMEKIFGKKITEMKFFGFDYFEFAGAKHLIARSGWSKQGRSAPMTGIRWWSTVADTASGSWRMRFITASIAMARPLHRSSRLPNPVTASSASTAFPRRSL